MTPAAPRKNEVDTLQALQKLGILDTEPDAVFDALVQAASLACGVPISLVSLIDADRQWFKANTGLPGVSQTPRELAFCAHAVLGNQLFEVADARTDPRFADNPLVTGSPNIRFYAGAPLQLAGGHTVGTLCVIDREPRELNEGQRDILRKLATVASHALEQHRTKQVLAMERQRLEHVVEGILAGTWEWNVQTGEVRMNARAAEIIGLPPERVGQTHISMGIELAHPDDVSRIFAAVKQHLSGETPVFETEARFRHREGYWVWVMSRGRVMTRSADGQPEWMFGIHQDIHARKTAEERLRKAESFLERTSAIAGVGGWEIDLRTRALTWSHEVACIHGLPAGHQPTLEEALRLYEPAARIQLEAAIQTALDAGEGFDLTLQIQQDDGLPRWVRAVGSIERRNGKPVRLAGALQDVTESQRLTHELAAQYERTRVTLESIGDAVITTDPAGCVTWLNPVAERLTGWPVAEATGQPLAQVFRIVAEATRMPAENPVSRCLLEGKVTGLATHTVLISRDGVEFGIEDTAAPIRNAAGEVLGVVLVFHDVTEQRRLSGEMTYRATHDVLTGLVNRAEFENKLAYLLRKSHDEQSEHALLYIDLDQFKLVNDTCGHAIGDQLLQQVSRLLEHAVRARDTVARLGGDEFGLLLESCTVDQAGRVAQKICDAMGDYRFVHDDRRFRVGASIGLVPVDQRFASIAAMLQAADSSCYAAKEAGRNRVHVWYDSDVAMRARQHQMQWTTRIERALDEDSFVLFAQRITPLRGDPTDVHAEVLLRLVDDDGKLVPPGAFLPAAERFNLISRVDRSVLRKSVRWLEGLPGAHPLRQLSVNLSGQSVGDRAFHGWATELLTRAGPAICTRLCLEITETAAVTNLADASAFVEQVRALGVHVALDDFGAGASSFGYLKSLVVDTIKIDGQFIRDLVADPLDEAAVRCFVEVARVLGVKTVAEFVDNAEVLAKLKEIGVDFAQGFLLHKPEPIDGLIVAHGVTA